ITEILRQRRQNEQAGGVKQRLLVWPTDLTWQEPHAVLNAAFFSDPTETRFETIFVMTGNDRSRIRDLGHRLDQPVEPFLPVDSAEAQDIEAFGQERLHVRGHCIRRESARGIDAVGNHCRWCECKTEIGKRMTLSFGREMNTRRLFEITTFDESNP